MTTRTPLSNPAKVMYPATGTTKADVAAYYDAIAPAMLPHLSRRPISLKRCPDGVEGEMFFEKRCPAQRPPWVQTISVASERFGTIEYCTVANRSTLAWLANRAALELHTYLFRAPAEDFPTMVVFDLDPGAPATLLDCLDVAMELRELLDAAGLQCLAKTSGGKGLHLAVPLDGRATFAATKGFAQAIARVLAERRPQRITTSMSKAARGGKVFIDWSQNDHGKTTVCAYSLRARPHPTVSTPVTWKEIEAVRRSRAAADLVFETDAVVQRVAKLGDLFKPALTMRQPLPEAATV